MEFKSIEWRQTTYNVIQPINYDQHCMTNNAFRSLTPGRYTTKSRRNRSFKSPLRKRSRLANDIDDEEKLIVVVRPRPLNEEEMAKSVSQIESGKHSIVFQKKDEDTVILLDPNCNILERGPRQRAYRFQKVFGMNASNEDVYKFAVAPLVQSVLNGYNATCFAYGVTGVGKTHTMIGTTSPTHVPGMYTLSAADIFASMRNYPAKEFKVFASFLEIYNERIKDLISPENNKHSNFRVHEDLHGVHVRGLTEILVTSAAQLEKLIRKGNMRRTTVETRSNKTSSRSHAILQLSVTISDVHSHMEETIGKLSLIDLAGSERNTTYKDLRYSDRSVEGSSINRSLLALGKCILTLGELQDLPKSKRNAYVPFRDSKLTHILKDSLGGNTRTVMIACISPSFLCFEDTLNTLKYASRAARIKRKVVQNTSTADKILHYKQIINALQSEVKYLRRILRKRNSPLKPEIPMDIIHEPVNEFRVQFAERFVTNRTPSPTRITSSRRSTTPRKKVLSPISIVDSTGNSITPPKQQHTPSGYEKIFHEPKEIEKQNHVSAAEDKPEKLSPEKPETKEKAELVQPSAEVAQPIAEPTTPPPAELQSSEIVQPIVEPTQPIAKPEEISPEKPETNERAEPEKASPKKPETKEKAELVEDKPEKPSPEKPEIKESSEKLEIKEKAKVVQPSTSLGNVSLNASDIIHERMSIDKEIQEFRNNRIDSPNVKTPSKPKQKTQSPIIIEDSPEPKAPETPQQQTINKVPDYAPGEHEIENPSKRALFDLFKERVYRWRENKKSSRLLKSSLPYETPDKSDQIIAWVDNLKETKAFKQKTLSLMKKNQEKKSSPQQNPSLFEIRHALKELEEVTKNRREKYEMIKRKIANLTTRLKEVGGVNETSNTEEYQNIKNELYYQYQQLELAITDLQVVHNNRKALLEELRICEKAKISHKDVPQLELNLQSKSMQNQQFVNKLKKD